MSKSNDILASLMRVLPTVPKHRLGLVLDFSRRLGGTNGSDWEARFKGVLRERVGGTKVVKRKLLSYVTTIQTVATDKFSAAANFIEGQEVDGVRTGEMSKVFIRYVLPLVRNDVPAADIRVHRLEHQSRDSAIRRVIGKDKEAIEISQFFQVLKASTKRGTVIIAYIRGGDGKLIVGSDGEPLAVYGYLYFDGWDLDAYSVRHPYPWDVGFRFCSL